MLAALRRQLGGGDIDLAQVPLHELQQAARRILLEDTRRRMATADARGD